MAMRYLQWSKLQEKEEGVKRGKVKSGENIILTISGSNAVAACTAAISAKHGGCLGMLRFFFKIHYKKI